MLSDNHSVRTVTYLMVAMLLVAHTDGQSFLRLLFGLPEPRQDNRPPFLGPPRQRRPEPPPFAFNRPTPRPKSLLLDILESLDPRRLFSGFISPPNNDVRPFVPPSVDPPRRPQQNQFRPSNQFPFRIESGTDALRLGQFDSDVKEPEPEVSTGIKVFESIRPDILENAIFRFEKKNASSFTS